MPETKYLLLNICVALFLVKDLDIGGYRRMVALNKTYELTNNDFNANMVYCIECLVSLSVKLTLRTLALVGKSETDAAIF